jgi:hypothetical protein
MTYLTLFMYAYKYGDTSLQNVVILLSNSYLVQQNLRDFRFSQLVSVRLKVFIELISILKPTIFLSHHTATLAVEIGVLKIN